MVQCLPRRNQRPRLAVVKPHLPPLDQSLGIDAARVLDLLLLALQDEAVLAEEALGQVVGHDERLVGELPGVTGRGDVAAKSLDKWRSLVPASVDLHVEKDKRPKGLLCHLLLDWFAIWVGLDWSCKKNGKQRFKMAQ